MNDSTQVKKKRPTWVQIQFSMGTHDAMSLYCAMMAAQRTLGQRWASDILIIPKYACPECSLSYTPLIKTRPLATFKPFCKLSPIPSQISTPSIED
ncbi:hypothetical protein PGT21_031418 [Puccinia graminis f. sp. tritici]|uniref:Uncharacterized protein n=1 Tax=Puccinia graminis f. sp. tritici TaxID=56615 RepID=A0A5B0PE07_PUCGR|nr:hypothetical protein PGTUg99_005210 [Puccinia graminis f. sp. tritici]KAA1104771.1 hypothetical protein PGT21_031418 [Puccinia graminis f. sp. tritici]